MCVCAYILLLHVQTSCNKYARDLSFWSWVCLEKKERNEIYTLTFEEVVISSLCWWALRFFFKQEPLNNVLLGMWCEFSVLTK